MINFSTINTPKAHKDGAALWADFAVAKSGLRVEIPYKQRVWYDIIGHLYLLVMAPQ
jgi:hypothetical protein